MLILVLKALGVFQLTGWFGLPARPSVLNGNSEMAPEPRAGSRPALVVGEKSANDRG